MSIFKECTIYNSGKKIILNLALAQSIDATEYQEARAIITFPDSAGEQVSYYVRETYEELRAAILYGG
jgi:hypothetical protein